MELTTVYRVEDRSESGPYCNRAFFRLLDPSDTVRILHRSKFTFLR